MNAILSLVFGLIVLVAVSEGFMVRKNSTDGFCHTKYGDIKEGQSYYGEGKNSSDPNCVKVFCSRDEFFFGVGCEKTTETPYDKTKCHLEEQAGKHPICCTKKVVCDSTNNAGKTA